MFSTIWLKLLSDIIKRGTLSKNRKFCLDLINIEAKRQPRGLGRFSDSPETHAARPRTRYQLSASPEAPPERPQTRYRFSASLEAGSAATPSPPPRPGRHVQLTQPTTPATSAERWLDTAEWSMRWESHRHHAARDRMGQGLPAAVLGTVPTTDTHTTLCYLTPAPRTARHGESCPGPYSLGINVQRPTARSEPRLSASGSR